MLGCVCVPQTLQGQEALGFGATGFGYVCFYVYVCSECIYIYVCLFVCTSIYIYVCLSVYICADDDDDDDGMVMYVGDDIDDADEDDDIMMSMLMTRYDDDDDDEVERDNLGMKLDHTGNSLVILCHTILCTWFSEYM